MKSKCKLTKQIVQDQAAIQAIKLRKIIVRMKKRWAKFKFLIQLEVIICTINKIKKVL